MLQPDSLLLDALTNCLTHCGFLGGTQTELAGFS
jgi:hypothetical protein